MPRRLSSEAVSSTAVARGDDGNGANRPSSKGFPVLQRLVLHGRGCHSSGRAGWTCVSGSTGPVVKAGSLKKIGLPVLTGDVLHEPVSRTGNASLLATVRCAAAAVTGRADPTDGGSGWEGWCRVRRRCGCATGVLLEKARRCAFARGASLDERDREDCEANYTKHGQLGCQWNIARRGSSLTLLNVRVCA